MPKSALNVHLSYNLINGVIYMKRYSLILILFSIKVFANPFNYFEGKYQVDGKAIVKNFNAKGCIRHDLPNANAIELKADTNGYMQSHAIYVYNDIGWNGLAVMQYENKSDFDPRITYFSRISGDSNYASNITGSNSVEHFEDKFSFERKNNKLVFNFSEEYIVNGNIQAGCYYQLNLK